MTRDPIGRLSARVRLEQPSGPPDALGGAPRGFAPHSEAWGELLADGVRSEEGEEGARYRARFVVRLRPPCPARSGWRVALGERRFRVLACRIDGPWAHLHCEEDLN